MDTTGAAPPANAIQLFNGKDLANWTTREGGAPEWTVEEDVIHVVPRAGDIVTKDSFTDCYLHIEFRCPNMPDASGQQKGNSGIFLQGLYEIQVLDSYGINIPGTGDCGAFYEQFAPLVNACRPPMTWQAYDITFRSPRFDDSGAVSEHARATIVQNGLIVQNNVQLLGPTGSASKMEVVNSGPLRLQDHKDLVCFRNIWAIPLPLEGSHTYEPG
jgi:hypothetical protein